MDLSVSNLTLNYEVQLQYDFLVDTKRVEEIIKLTENLEVEVGQWTFKLYLLTT